LLDSLPLATGEYGTASNRLRNAHRYLVSQERGAARYELKLLSGSLRCEREAEVRPRRRRQRLVSRVSSRAACLLRSWCVPERALPVGASLRPRELVLAFGGIVGPLAAQSGSDGAWFAFSFDRADSPVGFFSPRAIASRSARAASSRAAHKSVKSSKVPGAQCAAFCAASSRDADIPCVFAGCSSPLSSTY
jgi:hypothetical protein